MSDKAKTVVAFIQNTPPHKIAMFVGGSIMLTSAGVGGFIAYNADSIDDYVYFLLATAAFGAIIFLFGIFLAYTLGAEQSKTERMKMRMEYNEKRREELLEHGADPNKLADKTTGNWND